MIHDLDGVLGCDRPQIENEQLHQRPQFKHPALRTEAGALFGGRHVGIDHPFNEGSQAVKIALHHGKEFARLGQGGCIHACLQLLGDERHRIERRAQIMSDEGEVLLLALLANEGLLRGEGHDGHAHRSIDAVIDDVRRLTHDVKSVPLGVGDEGNAQQIVLGDDLPHVQAIVKTLDAMRGRRAAGMLGREGSRPPQREITNNFRDYLRDVIRDGGPVQGQFFEQQARLQPPFVNDFTLMCRKDFSQMCDRALLKQFHEQTFPQRGDLRQS